MVISEEIYYNASFISPVNGVTINISVYNSLNVWQETLYYDISINISTYINVNTTELNGGIITFNSTGYSLGVYEIVFIINKTNYMSNYTIRNQFEIREPNIISYIEVADTSVVISSLTMGWWALVDIEITSNDVLYNANINISIYTTSGGIDTWIDELDDSIYNLEKNSVVVTTDIFGSTVMFNTNDYIVGVYILKLNIQGDEFNLVSSWGLTILPAIPISVSSSYANIRTYSDLNSINVNSSFILNSTIYIDGFAIMNISTANANIKISLYSDTTLIEELVNTTWSFVGGVQYTLKQINLNSVISWTSNQTGQLWVVVTISKNNILSDYVTEDFYVGLETPEIPEGVVTETEFYITILGIMVPLIIIIVVLVVTRRIQKITE
jgi:hypothetical protein